MEEQKISYNEIKQLVDLFYKDLDKLNDSKFDRYKALLTEMNIVYYPLAIVVTNLGVYHQLKQTILDRFTLVYLENKVLFNSDIVFVNSNKKLEDIDTYEKYTGSNIVAFLGGLDKYHSPYIMTPKFGYILPNPNFAEIDMDKLRKLMI